MVTLGYGSVCAIESCNSSLEEVTHFSSFLMLTLEDDLGKERDGRASAYRL